MNYGYKIIGILVGDDEQSMRQEFDRMLLDKSDPDLEIFDHNQEIQLISKYAGLGYGLNTKQELEFIKSVAVNTGLVLDPTYTGKAFYGMVQELNKSDDIFPGDVLFIHTGGIFGLLSGNFEISDFN